MLNFLNFLEYFLKNNLQQLSPLHNLYSFVVTLKYNYEHKLYNQRKATINQENYQINKQRNSFLNAENNALLFFSKNYSHNISKLETNYKKKKIKKKDKEKEKDKYKDQQKREKKNLAQATKDRKRALRLRRTGTEDPTHEGAHIYDMDDHHNIYDDDEEEREDDEEEDEEEEEEDHSNNTYFKNFFTFNYSNIFPKLLSTSSYIHKKEEQVNAYSDEQNVMKKMLSMHKKKRQITKNNNYNYNEQAIDGGQGLYYNLYNNKTKPYLRPTPEQHKIMDEHVSYIKGDTPRIRNDYEELLAYRTNNKMLLRENEKKKKKKKKKKKPQAPNITHISFTHNLNITKGNI